MTERNGATMTPPIPRLEDCPHPRLESDGELPTRTGDTMRMHCPDCGYTVLLVLDARDEPIVYGDDADTELLPTADIEDVEER